MESMRFKDCVFRDLLVNVCSIKPAVELNRKLLCHNDEESMANRILFSSFIEGGGGLRLLLLGYANKDKKSGEYQFVEAIKLADLDDNERIIFERRDFDDIEEYDAEIIEIDERLREVFSERLEFIDAKNAGYTDQILQIREKKELDKFRDKYAPDVLMIELDHGGKAEKALMQSRYCESGAVYGELITEPSIECKLHMRDEIPAVLDENGEHLICPIDKLVEDEEVE